MAKLPKLETLSLAEYLAGEARRTRPYEYLDGQVYPLPEESPAHAQLRQNLTSLLKEPTEREGSRFYSSDRLKIGANRVYYPDLMVVSQPSENPQYLEYPNLVVEIATWETERTDRGEKLLMYQSIPGLVMYLVIHSERRVVEVLERGLRGNWRYQALGHDGEIELYSPQVKLGLGEIYKGL
ncbi:MAG: Uma2 family endonuclease [Thermaceae bacterium]|nr:Uma2 family endonuclease [Thermaceae bacterium]